MSKNGIGQRSSARASAGDEFFDDCGSLHENPTAGVSPSIGYKFTRNLGEADLCSKLL